MSTKTSCFGIENALLSFVKADFHDQNNMFCFGTPLHPSVHPAQTRVQGCKRIERKGLTCVSYALAPKNRIFTRAREEKKGCMQPIAASEVEAAAGDEPDAGLRHMAVVHVAAVEQVVGFKV